MPQRRPLCIWELGEAVVEVYEKLDALAGGYLDPEYTGSVKSNSNTMMCLALYDSDELDRLARDSAKRRPSESSTAFP